MTLMIYSIRRKFPETDRKNEWNRIAHNLITTNSVNNNSKDDREEMGGIPSHEVGTVHKA